MITKHESIFGSTPDENVEGTVYNDSTSDSTGELVSEPPVHQSHYVNNMVETLDIIKLVERQLKDSVDPYIGFCVGNVIKYVSRFPFKYDSVGDLEKAKVYIDYIIDHVKKTQNHELNIETADILLTLQDE